jgi:hypothetical protein
MGKKIAEASSQVHAASRSNRWARDNCEAQAQFACPLRIMWIITSPRKIRRAPATDLNLSIDHALRLIAR